MNGDPQLSPDSKTPSAALPDTQYAVPASAWRVRDMPSTMRPREAAERLGITNVPPDILIAILMRTGVRGLNVMDLARTLLQRFGSLTALAAAPVEDLQQLPGMGPVKAQMLKTALELGRRLNEEAIAPHAPIRSPADVAAFMTEIARALEHEVFWILLLDAKNRLKTQPLTVSQGLLDASLVHPREVFRQAIARNCAAVILSHNHPSGDPAPSAEDLRVTRQLVAAGKVIDIRVLDHVIIGREGNHHRGYCSLRDDGLVDFS